MFDPVKKRYEPPFPVRSDSQPFSKQVSNPQYEFKMDENLPGFKVIRASDKRSL